MAVTVSYPGVYIDEFTPAAPIQGVGTSTAAFLGLCKYGPANTPTLVTSWDQFVQAFTSGDPVNNPPNDDDYLWYAVRGYFQNGGQVCYVVPISNALPDSVVLPDETGANTVKVVARRSGISNPQISASATAAHTVAAYDAAALTTGARLFEPAVAHVIVAMPDLSKATFPSVDAAAQFLAGDRLMIVGGGFTEFAVVGSRSQANIFLTTALTHAYTDGTVTLAPLDPFATNFRIRGDTAAGLVSGSIVTLSQDPGGGAPDTTLTTIVTTVARQRISSSLVTYAISVQDGLNGFTLYGPNPITLQSEEFNLTVTGLPQPYSGLSMNPGHPLYYMTVVNGDPSGSVNAFPADGPPNTTSLPKNRPSSVARALTGGAQFDASVIKARTSDYESALGLLEGILDVNIVLVPDRTDVPVQAAVLDHCFRLQDRFAIFDAAKGTLLADIATQRLGLENSKGFGALYYPWLQVVSEKTGSNILMPPSGYVAGIYARTDLARGVFKAPAGTEAVVEGAIGVERLLSNADQGTINLKGINVIRVFQNGGRPVVWGARTTSADTNWQYVNIRRLFIFLEQSIQIGIKGSVFEPSNQSLWQKLNRTISAFLTDQWRDGALFGSKVEDAFYVRIDDVLNPPSDRALGRLTIEIGVCPSYPAEFIIVRIGIWQGGSSVSET